MKRAANLKSVEWHEPAFKADRSPTLDDSERQSLLFEDEDARGSGVHVRETQPLPPSDEADVADDEDADSALDQVGPYRIIERIGSGAMGHVYRAEHTLLGRVVAIKMLRPELTRDEACVRRFLAEARAVNLIAHDHIIDVTDFACTPSGQPWFVMEMLEGSDLALAAAHEPLSLTRALEITRQLCDALAAAHTAGIVHRDVKPENIFLQQREGRDYVTLLDFGIARLPDPSSPDPLQEGLMGTPHYMAPEQISASAIDHRADLYAVGSVLFELVAGAGITPFRSATLQKQLMDVLMQPAPQLSSRASVPAVIRDRLDRLVARCLEKQPSDRPSSAREIADELIAIAAELEPPVAASETPTLMLRGGDAARISASDVLRLSAADASEGRGSSASQAPVEAVETRRRARRELRVRRAWSSRGATMLSAAAAALAMWIATSETSWAHAVSRVTAWRNDGATEVSHIVQPAAPVDDGFATAHVAEPIGGIGATEPILAAIAPAAMPEIAVPSGVDADEIADRDRDARETSEQRRARRAARAHARAEREAADAVPALIIKPAPEPVYEEPTATPAVPAQPQAPEAPVYDRDLVLNPFEG
jgi:serine/threonine protein kinase